MWTTLNIESRDLEKTNSKAIQNSLKQLRTAQVTTPNSYCRTLSWNAMATANAIQMLAVRLKEKKQRVKLDVSSVT